jgi:hypothetical protein
MKLVSPGACLGKNAVSIGKYYSLDEIKELTISYDPEADIGFGSEIRLNVKAHLKNGKVKPFTKWNKASVEVQGGKEFHRSGKFYLRVASDLAEIEDHQAHIAIKLKPNPKIQGSAAIRLNYKGTTHVDFDGAPGLRGTNGVKGGSWGQWNGGDGRDGNPGRDGKSAQDVIAHIRRDPELVDGHQLVRVTARTVESEREYFFNVAGGRLLVCANGGSGGAGGNGGKGGRGNDGKWKGDKYRYPGNGGDGGSGAHGGDGGNGGNITVFLHPDLQSLYEDGVIEFSAAAGAPGGGGKAGKYGRGGAGKRGYGAVSPGSNGRSGRRGTAGQAGSAGAITVRIQETPDWTGLTQPLFAAGQVWKGHYVCRQGQTELELQVTEVDDEQVSAVFRFTVSAEISGSFRIHGEYQPSTRRISFRPGEWISQPAGYVGVSLTGHIDQTGSVITGEIDGPSCGAFEVRRR